MQRLRIYVDTSVFGGCFDREYQESSQAFFQLAFDQRIILLISNLVAIELKYAPPEVRQFFFSLPGAAVESIRRSYESIRLRNLYLNAGVLGPKHLFDADHIALATIAQADLIVSWNFRHMVHPGKIRGFNHINRQEDYPPVDIRTPGEVIKR
jgi:hypothetical protein